MNADGSSSRAAPSEITASSAGGDGGDGGSISSSSSLIGDEDSATSETGLIMRLFSMEIAISTHSIFVGFTLGAIDPQNDSFASLIPLVVALLFHQFFEGLALGITANKAGVLDGTSRRNKVNAMFTASFAIGGSIGLLLSMVGDPASKSAMFTSGILDGVAAGMLTAVFFSLQLDTHSGQKRNDHYWEKIFSTVAGVAVMAVIAIWS
jgi:zinc transporter 1/2/3